MVLNWERSLSPTFSKKVWMEASSFPSNRAQRPFGITIIVLLEALGSSLFLIVGILLLAYAGYAAAFFPRHPLLAGATLLAMGIVSFLLGIGGFLICWGLWTGQGWAWSIALALAILKILLSLLQFPIGIPSMLIYVLVAYYLWQPHVKAFYGKLEGGVPYGTETRHPFAGDRTFCPRCGASNSFDANFCFQCGYPLKAKRS
jgi:hypothetical protein